MEFSIILVVVITFVWLLFKKLPDSQRTISNIVITALVLGGGVAGQLISDDKKTYPFANWSMYSSANPGLNYVEFILETDEGERFHYPFSIISKTSPRAFMKKIADLESDLADNLREKKRVKPEHSNHPFEKLIASLVDIYSEENPEVKIVFLRINGVLYEENSLDDKSIVKYNYYTYHTN
ncbi:hypothetical protein DYD21_13170 [Rhodohalobacter sp. SW132]|uniref:hypothetical protein n=1 Tax=Rhodohalobacter sp. SW132 TaxID=2293433 RepID=UPI000E28988C|nr:hypothetical protein [Rhodohalobacter sp. SW132]REL33199.1 hypothetical protein DYD21_13170 [Rhodohalobacter sp. SW132]